MVGGVEGGARAASGVPAFELPIEEAIGEGAGEERRELRRTGLTWTATGVSASSCN